MSRKGSTRLWCPFFLSEKCLYIIQFKQTSNGQSLHRVIVSWSHYSSSTLKRTNKECSIIIFSWQWYVQWWTEPQIAIVMAFFFDDETHSPELLQDTNISQTIRFGLFFWSIRLWWYSTACSDRIYITASTENQTSSIWTRVDNNTISKDGHRVKLNLLNTLSGAVPPRHSSNLCSYERIYINEAQSTLSVMRF